MSFYSRDPTSVAPDLIGKQLVREYSGNRTLRGIIVEVEAYRGSDDPASHAFRGLTKRNRIMFGRAGLAYVYFTYGFHHCLNVVTGNEGEASAVLIRALEPTEGIEFLKHNRNNPVKEIDLTNGPGKICQAFGIDRRQNGIDLTSSKSELRIESGKTRPVRSVLTSSRVGIRVGVDKNWRYYDPSSPFISSKRVKEAPSSN